MDENTVEKTAREIGAEFNGRLAEISVFITCGGVGLSHGHLESYGRLSWIESSTEENKGSLRIGRLWIDGNVMLWIDGNVMLELNEEENGNLKITWRTRIPIPQEG